MVRGPFHRLATRAHLTDAQGRIRGTRIALLAWLPFAIAALVEGIVLSHTRSLWTDITVHVRLLVMAPLVIAADHVLEQRCIGSLGSVRAEPLIPPEQVDRLSARAEALRSAWYVEALLAAIALAGGMITVWTRGESGFVAEIAYDTGVSLSSLWYGVLALPLVQFLVARWIWQWLVWTYVLIKLSRMDLATNAVHPDRCAGLKMLATPVDGLALFVLGLGSLLSASWLERVFASHVSLQSLLPGFLAFLVIALAVACGPLLLFATHIYRARVRDAHGFHRVAHDLAGAFRRKWMGKTTPHPEPHLGMLDDNDFSALIDMDSAFEVTASTWPLQLCRAPLRIVTVAAVVPMVPLVLAEVPLQEVAKRLGGMLLGLG